MTTFRSLSVVRRPVGEVYEIVRDRLCELVPLVDDVRSIETLERHEEDGVVRLLNRWVASQRVPDAIARVIGTDEIAWLDHNEWDAAAMVCRWTIEPSLLTEHIACSGTTTYEPAMAGRGCRVTLTGSFELGPAALSRFSRAVQRPTTSLIETMVSTIIPRGTRKVAEAAAGFDGG